LNKARLCGFLGIALILFGVTSYFNPNVLPYQLVSGDWVFPKQYTKQYGWLESGDVNSLSGLDGACLSVWSQDVGINTVIKLSFDFDLPMSESFQGRLVFHAFWADSVPAYDTIPVKLVSSTQLFTLGTDRRMFATPYFSVSEFSTVTFDWSAFWSSQKITLKIDQMYVELLGGSMDTVTTTVTQSGQGTTTITVTTVKASVVTSTIAGKTTTFATTVMITTVKTLATGVVTTTIKGTDRTVVTTYTYTVEKTAKAGKSDWSWAFIAIGAVLAGVGFNTDYRNKKEKLG